MRWMEGGGYYREEQLEERPQKQFTFQNILLQQTGGTRVGGGVLSCCQQIIEIHLSKPMNLGRTIEPTRPTNRAN